MEGKWVRVKHNDLHSCEKYIGAWFILNDVAIHDGNLEMVNRLSVELKDCPMGAAHSSPFLTLMKLNLKMVQREFLMLKEISDHQKEKVLSIKNGN